MTQKNMKRHYQSMGGDGASTAQTQFNPDLELAKRVDEAAELMRQLSEDCDRIDREKAYHEQIGNDTYNRALQAWQDKQRARSSEEEKRKLLAELKERVKKTQGETAKVNSATAQTRKRSQALKNITDRLDQGKQETIKVSADIDVRSRLVRDLFLAITRQLQEQQQREIVEKQHHQANSNNKENCAAVMVVVTEEEEDVLMEEVEEVEAEDEEKADDIQREQPQQQQQYCQCESDEDEEEEGGEEVMNMDDGDESLEL